MRGEYQCAMGLGLGWGVHICRVRVWVQVKVEGKVTHLATLDNQFAQFYPSLRQLVHERSLARCAIAWRPFREGGPWGLDDFFVFFWSVVFWSYEERVL